jgi:hypothetical protein
MLTKLSQLFLCWLLAALIWLGGYEPAHASSWQNVQSTWTEFGKKVDVIVNQLEDRIDRPEAEKRNLSLSEYRTVRPILRFLYPTKYQIMPCELLPTQDLQTCFLFKPSRSLASRFSLGYLIPTHPTTYEVYGISPSETEVEKLQAILGSVEWIRQVRLEKQMRVNVNDEGIDMWIHPKCLTIDKHL